MKFENIRVGMLVQSKETGDIYTVESSDMDGYYLNNSFIDYYKDKTTWLHYDDADLFRKYKEQE